MPRTSRRKVKSPQQLRQDTLDGFVASSPPRPQPPSPQPSPRVRGRAGWDQVKKKRELRSSGKKRTWRGVDDDELEYGRTLAQSDSESTDVGGIQFEPEKPEEEQQPRPTQKKRRLRVQVDSDEDEEVQGSSPLKPIEVDKNEDEDEDDAIENYISWKSKVSRAKRKTAIPEDSDEDTILRPRKRKLVKGVRPESNDEDDEDSLVEELNEEKILQSRFRTRGKKSAFQKNLEKLKRKKKGQPIESPSESEEDESEDEVKPFSSAKPCTGSASGSGSGSESGDNDGEEEPEDSFIVEDDDGAAVVDLPAQFSMNTFQDLIHQFKVICQLFVHVAVAKPEERHETMVQLLGKEYFSFPLKITRRKLDGMRDSLVASSVWRPEFKRPLEKYPHIDVFELEFAVPGCVACRLGRRVSTRVAKLYGQPYDRLGFEPEDDSEDEENDSGSEGADSDDSEVRERRKSRLRYRSQFDSLGRPRASFDLGRFCCARTRVYHAFCHWEYATFQSLLGEIDALRSGVSSHGFARVAWSGAKPPQDTDDPDALMDWLDQRNIITAEWERVKTMMQKARKLEAGGRGGDDDDDDVE